MGVGVGGVSKVGLVGDESRKGGGGNSISLHLQSCLRVGDEGRNFGYNHKKSSVEYMLTV